VPLKLRPPRKGKTPNFEIRGTYLGVRVEVSSGTHKRSVALAQLDEIEECIEQHGQYPAPEVKPDPGRPTFLTAANAYMQRRRRAPLRSDAAAPFPRKAARGNRSGRDRRRGRAAAAGAPDYKNRAVYAPTIAILRQALGDKCPPVFQTAEGYRRDASAPTSCGRRMPFSILHEADAIDAEFELYLLVLLYNGIRKSEGPFALAADTGRTSAPHGCRPPRTAIRAC
jgi:hypothetical protein